MEKYPLHLKLPDLQSSPEVDRAVKKREHLTGEKLQSEPSDRIEAYLDRLECLVLDPESEQNKKDIGDIEHTERPRALSLLREMILNEYVRPNKEQMAQGAARVEHRVARQMGIEAEYTNETLEQRGEIAVGDLESSLDQWINYLSDPNEPYPTWFRYYAFRNILNLGEYDKDKQEFPRRSKGTFKLFPDVDRGALAYVEEIMTASQDDTILARVREIQKEFGAPEADIWTPEKATAFTKLSFAKQYAKGIEAQGSITPELRAETRGEWVKYAQGDDPKELWKSLQNKGTAWCTRGYPTAKTQLEGGDFHVYYTLDTQGNPTIPRIAIRMRGSKKIAEDPRGVLDSKQNLEPNMLVILEEKLSEFGTEAARFKKKSADMKRLTALEEEIEKGHSLSKDDLLFLYEVNTPISGFGYQDDPRISELREKRDLEKDMPIVFDCMSDQIAHSADEITKNTKVYVGSLSSRGIFKKLSDVEYIYTSFPEKRITKRHFKIGGKSPEDLLNELYEKDIRVPFDLQKKLKFINTSPEPIPIDIICLTIEDLGFNGNVTAEEVYQRAISYGLDLCPTETGLSFRLQYTNQPNGENLLIASKDTGKFPYLFKLSSDRGQLILGSEEIMHSTQKIAFRLIPRIS